MKKIYTQVIVLACFMMGAGGINSQNLVFSYVKTSPAPGQTTISISVTNTGGATENLGAFTTQLYYNDDETTATGADFSPVQTGFGWGSANETQILYQATVDPDVLIDHTGYFSYQNFDFVNFTGVDIPAGETLAIGSIFFNNADGTSPTDGGAVWLAEGDEITGLTYSDINFAPEYPIEVDEATQSGILPIYIHKFTATKDNKSVILDWSTASEINGSHFEVERSQDLDFWTMIGTVDAVGESHTIQDYQLVDTNLPLSTRDAQKTFYYRLKMVDTDGTFEYSEVRVARFEQELGSFIAYPNPAYNEVFVNLSSITAETGPATMSVVDKSGRLVQKVMLPSSDDISVDVSGIAPGAYFFVVTLGQETYTQKIIKID